VKIDLKSLTIKKAHEAMKNGEYTPLELADAYLEVIKEKNDELNIFLEIFNDVPEQAKHAGVMFKNGEAGAMTGIPVGIKDNILFEGHKASAASKILEGYTATYDSTVVRKLREAGAVILGRLNMDEFAMGASTENSAYGPTKNPVDPERVPGGSSGGSAAAVAANMCLASLGSDTAGSIRQPSALCGVVGLKPTYGNVSRSGLIALGSSLDVIGPIAMNVEDVEIVYECIKGEDRMDSTSKPESLYERKEIGKPVIGIPRHFLKMDGVNEKVLENFANAEDKLKTLGYEVKDVQLTNARYAVPAYYIILPAEASANLARFDGVKYGLHVGGENLIEDYSKTRGAGFGPEVKRRILIGAYVLSAGYSDAYYNKATAVRDLIAQDYKDAFKEVDVILTPTTAGPAFKLGEKVNDPVAMYLEDVFTVPANHVGLPAISIPSGTVSVDGKNLPLGVHFVAPHQREDLLLKISKDFLKNA